MKTIGSKGFSFILILTLFCGLLTAINTESTYSASKKIHLKKTTVSLVVGNGYQQKLIGKTGKAIKATKIKWKSSKPSVAKISKYGKITSVKPGTAKMTAKYQRKTYTFTVKVRKPDLSAVDFDLYAFFSEVAIGLHNAKDAKEYEIYVSIDGGDFELYDVQKPDPDMDLHFYLDEYIGEFLEKKTCTFKLRGVRGNDKGEYSAEKTVVMMPRNNTEISATPSDFTLRIGETKTVRVDTDGGYAIVSSGSNNNTTSEWGDWIARTKSVNFNVTGRKEGTTLITISDKKNPSVKAEIKVEVLGGLQSLYEYIDEFGGVNDKGEKIIPYHRQLEETEIAAGIKKHSDCIEFICVNEKNSSDFESGSSITMKMYLPESSSVRPEISFYITSPSSSLTSYLIGSGYVNCASYSRNSDITFNIEESNIPSSLTDELQITCNNEFREAMAVWNYLLRSELNMTLSDIGFTNY